MGRAPCCEKVGLKRGRWTAAEDELLLKYIAAHGEGSWRSLPKNAGLLRCGKSCRLRWINYLRADLKRGNISHDEEATIAKLQLSLGNKWSLIASHLPGRTDNEIKNYWNSHLCRKAQSLIGEGGDSDGLASAQDESAVGGSGAGCKKKKNKSAAKKKQCQNRGTSKRKKKNKKQQQEDDHEGSLVTDLHDTIQIGSGPWSPIEDACLLIDGLEDYWAWSSSEERESGSHHAAGGGDGGPTATAAATINEEVEKLMDWGGLAELDDNMLWGETWLDLQDWLPGVPPLNPDASWLL